MLHSLQKSEWGQRDPIHVLRQPVAASIDYPTDASILANGGTSILFGRGSQTPLHPVPPDTVQWVASFIKHETTTTQRIFIWFY